MKKKVNIIIVNYNCWQDTLECIESLLKSQYDEFQIFIVDNNSTDRSMNYFQRWADGELVLWLSDGKIGKKLAYPFSEEKKNYRIYENELLLSAISYDETKKSWPIIFFQSRQNLGYAGGNNIIINFLLQYANKDEMVWILNPDTVVEKHTIKSLAEDISSHKKVILGSIILDYQEPENILFYGGFYVRKMCHGIKKITMIEEKDNIDAISGTSLFVKMSVFSEIGVLPARYFMYWEEADFCKNAKKVGYVLDVCEDAVIYNKGGTSSKTKFIAEYLYLLNGLRYYCKYFPLHLPFILLSTFMKLIKSLFFNENTKVRAIFYAHLDFIKLLFLKIDDPRLA
jgi:GT2 family glycosyltransferase